jgi:hypothetical protein
MLKNNVADGTPHCYFVVAISATLPHHFPLNEIMEEERGV